MFSMVLWRGRRFYHVCDACVCGLHHKAKCVHAHVSSTESMQYIYLVFDIPYTCVSPKIQNTEKRALERLKTVMTIYHVELTVSMKHGKLLEHFSPSTEPY